MKTIDPGGPAQWRTRQGFLLATLGAAVGLGNVWRFSYITGENGGGAFLIVYLAAVLMLGWPLLIAELALGRSARADAPTALARIAPARPWRWLGWIGVVACLGILSYYPVIMGWVASYLWRYLLGTELKFEDGGALSQFQAVIADPGQALFWYALMMLATVAVVAAGVERGIERAGMMLMPAFVVLLVLLAGYGLSLSGAPRAASFLFAPRWQALLELETYLAAIGQAFFSIGLGMGVLVTYGAYVPAAENLPRAALLLVGGDTLVALLAGLIVFPAVFTYGVSPAYGPPLAFVALPEVFAQMPGGRWFAVAFFSMLAIAALTSAVSLLEVPVAWLVARRGWRRRRAAATVGLLVTLLGVPVALGYGPLAPEGVGSPTLLDRIDYLASNLLLPMSSIAVALLVGWRWPSARQATDLGAGACGAIWQWWMRIAAPLVIAIVMIQGLA